MAEENEDPREVAWHPRHRTTVLGHQTAQNKLTSAFASGKPHHAWLIHGPAGIGKATLAYAFAADLLGQGGDHAQAKRWIENRAHPDLFVLERSFTTTKPRRLRTEISVEDARTFIDQFGRTASGCGWRVGLVDNMDELNTESSNALLKLIEEPPTRSVILLLSNQKGRVLPTLQSRCLALPVHPLAQDETISVLKSIPLEKAPAQDDLLLAARLSNGSPGRALALMGSPAAKAFAVFNAMQTGRAFPRHDILAPLATSKSINQDYKVFMDLLLEWIGKAARTRQTEPLASAFAQLQEKQAVTEAYNLDRRTAILDHLYVLEDALKAA